MSLFVGYTTIFYQYRDQILGSKRILIATYFIPAAVSVDAASFAAKPQRKKLEYKHALLFSELMYCLKAYSTTLVLYISL